MELTDYETDGFNTATFYFDDEYPFAVEVDYNLYTDSYLVWNGYTDVDEYYLAHEWGVNDYWLLNPETGDRMEDPNHGLYSAKSCYESDLKWIQRQIDNVMDKIAEEEMKEREENWV